jgi:glycosyltransferase involved in cell wall biosynthesis
MRYPDSIVRAISVKRQNSLSRQLLFYLNLGLEIFRRYFASSKVCHPLYSTLSHPLFQQRNRSPQFVSTLSSKSLVGYSIGLSLDPRQHENCKKPLVVEIVDHPLHSAPLISGICQPFEYLQYCEPIETLYLSSNVNDIVVYSQKTAALFAHYFPNLSNVRFHVLPPPWRCNIDFDALGKPSRGLNFLAISSSFKHKATILLIEAWEQFLDFIPNKAVEPQLTLVCHDIPSRIVDTLPSSIVLLDKIPLSTSDKKRLFGNCHVYISCSVMDGIGPLEALSYAKPIISLNTINASQYVTSSNGFLVDIPYEYYDPLHYGTTWKLDSDFLSLITSQPSRRLIVNQLSAVMLQYANNPSLVDEHAEFSRYHFLSSFTLEYFSSRLSSIFSPYTSDRSPF